MRFLVMSDAHGGRSVVQHLIENTPQIDGYIYLGDTLEDIAPFKEMDKPFYYVPGNCDGIRENLKEEEVFEILGHRVLICHGHQYDVKRQKQSLYYKALSEEVELVLYGHTHIPEAVTLGDIIFFNPGSLTRPKVVEKPSYGIIEFKKDEIIKEIVFF